MVNILNFLSPFANFVSFTIVFMLICFEHRVINPNTNCNPNLTLTLRLTLSPNTNRNNPN